MSRRLTSFLALALVAMLLPAAVAAAPPKAPPRFFGVAPQAALNDEDGAYMRAARIGSLRLPLVWSGIQPSAAGGYKWESFDQAMAVAARAGQRVLPSIGSTPPWLARKSTTLPVDNGRQRAAWSAFLSAAVARYGPGGEFWAEHGPGSAEPLPAIPIRQWQIWNEPNFFYFAFPVSPARYAKLVTISSQAIKATDPGAEVVLAGLFGKPKARGRRGMPAAAFLERLYRVRGLSRYFDGVALHPYAVDTAALEGLVEELHEVTVKNHDRVPLYITEIGWGSQNDFKKVAFEQGIGGQVRELRGAYRYLLANRFRLNLRGVYWFSWRDLPGSCSFCDSVGFFRAGTGFRPKPAWKAFVAITGGRARP
jgi:hypothetical protein